MIYRIGFVSNSSTTSFVCDICDEELYGNDWEISRKKHFTCTEGHNFCREHGSYELEGKVSEIENDYEEMYSYHFEDKYGYSSPEDYYTNVDTKYCPICNTNGDRPKAIICPHCDKRIDLDNF